MAKKETPSKKKKIVDVSQESSVVEEVLKRKTVKKAKSNKTNNSKSASQSNKKSKGQSSSAKKNSKATQKNSAKKNSKPQAPKGKAKANEHIDLDHSGSESEDDLEAKILPGQKYPTPPKGDPVRAFYESMLKQKPNSEMALKHCIEYGCLTEQEANEGLIRLNKSKKK